MKIDSSYVGMESARRYSSWTGKKVESSLEAKISGQGSSEQKEGFAGLLNMQNQDNNITDMFLSKSQMKAQKLDERVNDLERQKNIETIRLECIMYLIRWLLTGMKEKMDSPSMMNQSNTDLTSEFGGFGAENNLFQANFHYEQTFYFEEREQTDFQTTGSVRTQDGREINFGLNLSLSREFKEYYQETLDLSTGQLMDPLVINLDNNHLASLSDQTFRFDLDADGEMENISYLNASSGYLALDLNQDNVINDGSELFGTKSGNGFADLAKYDLDQNGWIDENDEVFDKLKIWCKDENGEDILYNLKDKNVGAIYLGSSETDFSLNSLQTNHTNGILRRTGMFLYENGNVGTMQQLDLAT